MKKTVSFSKNATNVFFHILTACNLQCRHCYINPDQHGRNTLDPETIEAWLGELAVPGRPANVIFLGGEPTLHPDLDRAVRAARRLGYASVTVDTNGYLFHDILDRVRPEEVDFFSFSLDGATAATNDALRGDGSFFRCTAGAKAAAERGFSTSLIFTVSRSNIHELEKMTPLLHDLGIERFFIQVLGIRGKPADRPGSVEPVTRERWLDVVPEAARKIAESGIRTTYPKVFLDPGETFECAGRVADNCFVFPNGRVYRCPLCEDFPIHSRQFAENRIEETGGINEDRLFDLQIPEGCVMNRIVQPETLAHDETGRPLYRIACCMLKEEIAPG